MESYQFLSSTNGIVRPRLVKEKEMYHYRPCEHERHQEMESEESIQGSVIYRKTPSDSLDHSITNIRYCG